jgi:hypothetical protein
MYLQTILEYPIILDLVLDNLVRDHFIKDTDVLKDFENLRSVFVQSREIKNVIDEKKTYVENKDFEYHLYASKVSLLTIDHNLNTIVKTDEECIESIYQLSKFISNNKDILMKKRPKVKLGIEKTKNEIMKMNKRIRNFETAYGKKLLEQITL